jgi:hypothetical protein
MINCVLEVGASWKISRSNRLNSAAQYSRIQSLYEEEAVFALFETLLTASQERSYGALVKICMLVYDDIRRLRSSFIIELEGVIRIYK